MKNQLVPWSVRTAFGCLLLGAGACGWHAGLKAPDGATSVGIEVFPAERRILERDLEPLLNQAMTRAFVDLVATPLQHPLRPGRSQWPRLAQY